jgi:hypothetical protein
MELQAVCWGGSFAVELVAAFAWNGWQTSSGISGNLGLEYAGCYSLMKKINNLPNLRAHICGHIHESYGYAVRESDGVKFVNASICDERYLPINTPISIEL